MLFRSKIPCWFICVVILNPVGSCLTIILGPAIGSFFIIGNYTIQCLSGFLWLDDVGFCKTQRFKDN